MTDEQLTALHEASHGVIATMSGMDVRRCVLHRDGSQQAEAGRTELFHWADERDADAERFLVFLLAGRSAEFKATGRYSARGDGDLEHATHYAWAALNETDPSTPRVVELVRVAQIHADAMMEDPAVWGWIQRTARALVKRRSLSGRDVQLVWDELQEAR